MSQKSSDGTLETRRFFAQNAGGWRADVSAVLTDTGTLVERVKYSAYGTPFGLPAGDMNADGLIGTVGYDDEKEAAKLVGDVAHYAVRADIDLDGDIDTADITAINTSVGTDLGRGVLSGLETDSRKGYAGYECTGGSISECWHVRHRVLHTGRGRWIQRDPAGYVDGANLVQYVASRSTVGLDPLGLSASSVVDPFFIPSPWTPYPYSPNTYPYIPNTRPAVPEQPTDRIPIPPETYPTERPWWLPPLPDGLIPPSDPIVIPKPGDPGYFPPEWQKPFTWPEFFDPLRIPMMLPPENPARYRW